MATGFVRTEDAPKLPPPARVASLWAVWRERVEFTNGHTRDLNGDLLHCSHGLRGIMRTPMRDG